jgi:hypothetical protein
MNQLNLGIALLIMIVAILILKKVSFMGGGSLPPVTCPAFTMAVVPTSITCPTGYTLSGTTCTAVRGTPNNLACNTPYFTGNNASNMCEPTTYGKGAPPV